MKTNRIALITGASSGLGMVFARRFAQSGYDLVITGRRKEKLMHLADELEGSYGISVQWILAELSEESDVQKITEFISRHDNISVLVNNAGFGSGKEFSCCDLTEHMQMLQVHVITTLRLVHAVLPQMKCRKEGTIINLSSLGAFMPAPGSSMYSATKLFLKSFTESLHMELGKYGIRLHCLCPGFTRTDFHNRRPDGKTPKSSGLILWMNAEAVVDQCLKSLDKGKVVLVPGMINRMLVRIVSVLPRPVYFNLMMKLTRQPEPEEPVKRKVSAEVEPRFGNGNSREHLVEEPVPLL
jgi:hypothetical protein